jgi:dGTPase
LEVSQIARTLASSLGLNETLCEAIALSHDLGHTPFGHIGGDTLDELLKHDGHEFGFDHNFQSFRVLTKLEHRYDGFDGLNLTFATLEGVLKHSFPYKKNFLDSVDDRFALDKHPSLEAMVVDRADEIAYISHDIDDGIKYGLISWGDLLDLKLCKLVDAKVSIEGINTSHRLYRHRFVAALITLLVSEFISYSSKFVTQNISNNPICATIDSSIELEIGFEHELETAIKEVKKRLYQKLYRNEKIVKKMYSGSQCVKALYSAFKSDSYLLPNHQRDLLDIRSSHRVISDYIASMTDRYAMKNYHELYGFSL